MDLAGRDLLVQLTGSWRAIYLQVKVRTRLTDGTRLQCQVRRDTFQPAEDFWFSFYYFDA